MLATPDPASLPLLPLWRGTGSPQTREVPCVTACWAMAPATSCFRRLSPPFPRKAEYTCGSSSALIILSLTTPQLADTASEA